MQGIHSIDVGMLVSPILVVFMEGMAEIAEIEYNLGDKDKDEEPDKQLVQLAMKKLRESKDIIEEVSEAKEEPVQMEKPVGLMARRSE